LSVLAVTQASEVDDIVADDTWVGPQADQTGVSIARKGDRAIDQEKRYDDLTAIAKKYWQKNSTDKTKFDERKLWAYGCHCYILGDRPMSKMGKGKPVDALDRKCMAYKNCQKCVREVHGDECIGEMVEYSWKYSTKLQSFVGGDEVGSCQRDLYNCDLQFVEDTFAQQEVYNKNFNFFYGGFDANDGLSCLPGDPGEYVERVCKGGLEEPYVWTRKDQKEQNNSKPNKYGNSKPNKYGNFKPNKYAEDKPNKNKGKDKYDSDDNNNNNNGYNNNSGY